MQTPKYKKTTEHATIACVASMLGIKPKEGSWYEFAQAVDQLPRDLRFPELLENFEFIPERIRVVADLLYPAKRGNFLTMTLEEYGTIVITDAVKPGKDGLWLCALVDDASEVAEWIKAARGQVLVNTAGGVCRVAATLRSFITE